MVFDSHKLQHLETVYRNVRGKDSYDTKSPLYNIYREWIWEWNKDNKNVDSFDIKILSIMNDTLDMVNLVAEILGKNFKGEIIDGGCGCGLYTYELAKRLPNARVIGIDKKDYSSFYKKLGKYFNVSNTKYIVGTVEEYIDGQENREKRVVCLFNVESIIIAKITRNFVNEMYNKWNGMIFNYDIFTLRHIHNLIYNSNIELRNITMINEPSQLIGVAYKK